MLAALPHDVVAQLALLANDGAVPVVSVVMPVFNEMENLDAILDRIVSVLEPHGAFEVLVVDDGSTDGSLAHAIGRHDRDHRIKVVALSRNFGHQSALLAGLHHARGRAVVLMDADGQDPPELLPAMIERWQGGSDVVYGVRRNRQESQWKRTSYWLFYRFLYKVADLEIPPDAGDFCLMDRKVVDALRSLNESSAYLRGLRSWVGFTQSGLEYDRPAREAGEAKYTLRKLVRLALNGVMAFSAAPLRLASVLGVITSLLGFLYVGFAVAARLLAGEVPKGWTSLIAIILIVGGSQLFVIGVLGEYVARVYGETKRRPHYVVGSRHL
ncbi:MAG: polyisoprenyl-phosphate glycosyltransferase [Actinomycetota bacterium]